MSPRHFVCRTRTRVFPSTSIRRTVACDSSRWTSARLPRNASSTADTGCPGAPTSLSPGRSANSESRRSLAVTPSDAATLARTAAGASAVPAAPRKTIARARLGRHHPCIPLATLEPPEDFEGEFKLPRRALTREWLAQPGIQIALPPPDKPLMLLEEGSQPWMVVRSEEVRDYKGSRDAIADQTIG